MAANKIATQTAIPAGKSLLWTENSELSGESLGLSVEEEVDEDVGDDLDDDDDDDDDGLSDVGAEDVADPEEEASEDDPAEEDSPEEEGAGEEELLLSSCLRCKNGIGVGGTPTTSRFTAVRLSPREGDRTS